MFEGTVVSINITDTGKGQMRSVDEIRAVPGRGLEGDRYYNKTGTFSKTEGTGREVTLIELETIEALARDYGLTIDPGDPRRNIVVRGVPLNHLVGREFRVGDVTLRGMRLAGPCKHLASLTSDKVREALIHRGGLRADIVTEGVIKAGDVVRPA